MLVYWVLKLINPHMDSPLIVTGKPLEKLITVISQGIGVLYEPKRMRDKAKAEAFKIEVIAEAKANALLKTDEAEWTLKERALARVQAIAVAQQENIEAIADKSIQYLEDSVSDEKVDEDWRTRFFDKAQNVSNEALQEIWAKILANEVSSPGSISLRTLNILSDLTKTEGELFQIVCSISAGHVGIYHSPITKIFKDFGLKYYDIQLLKSARLIHSNEDLVSPLTYITSVDGCYMSYGGKPFILSTPKKESITFEVIILTEEAFELKKLINVPANMDYFYKLMADCKIKWDMDFREATSEDLDKITKEMNNG